MKKQNLNNDKCFKARKISNSYHIMEHKINRRCNVKMGLWDNRTNRTIFLSSIFFVVCLAIIIFLSIHDLELRPLPGLNWAFLPAPIYIIVIIAFWGLYFNLLLLIGSIREKMNALPGWSEVIFSALIVSLTSIFLGNLDNFLYKWIVFGGTFVGIILITLWFIMSSTPKDEYLTSA